MLRRDQDNAKLWYFHLILMLFKPWREVSDLRLLTDSWESVFKTLTEEMSPCHATILDNMQVLHECHNSKNDHMQTRIRTRAKSRAKPRDDFNDPRNEIEDIDMSEVLEHLDDMDRMSSRKLDEATQEAGRCLQELENAGFFSIAASEVECRNRSDVECPKSAEQADNILEDEWRDMYDNRKSAWKLKATTSGTNAVLPAAVVNSAVSVVPDTEQLPLTGELEVERGDGVLHSGDALVRVVAGRWTLNKEQTRAFEIVSRHTLQEMPEQLLLYLGGPGGTGKSRVVNALREFFGLRNQSRRFRLAAYTGVAARNIGGATLHSLLQMNDTGRELSAKNKQELTAMWEGVDYLFVDELSMLGCDMLHNVSWSLTEAKGNTAAFGGVNVILAGDFAQLPPIGDTRLYKNVDTTSLAASSTNRAQGKVLGCLLWLSFETVVLLDESMRQKGSENSQFVEMLGHLRDGVCNIDDYNTLAERGLRHQKNEDVVGTPVIVTNNATRDTINRRAAEAFAMRVGVELHWYHVTDTHKRVPVIDTSLIEKLEQQHSGQTKHRLRRIPLAIGMPVVVNQNFDVAAGVVNGSCGTLKKIRYFTNNMGHGVLNSCAVEIHGAEDVEVSHLPTCHFPILPETTELRFEHGGSHKRCTIQREQVPIEPGFAMTAHKASHCVYRSSRIAVPSQYLSTCLRQRIPPGQYDTSHNQTDHRKDN